jgi:5-methylthioadenosine/S-adenosylhomocysteine deaminase
LAREGVALESFSRYINSGINMGIGTDTFPPNIIEEMRLASLINKIIDGKKDTGTIKDVYNAATVGGAKALGRHDLGKLEIGCLADISIFNLQGLETGAIDDPMRTLLTAGTGRECDIVIVDGKMLVQNGKLIGIDEEDLMNKAQGSWIKYKNGVSAWDIKKRTVDLVVPQIFPFIQT